MASFLALVGADFREILARLQILFPKPAAFIKLKFSGFFDFYAGKI